MRLRKYRFHSRHDIGMLGGVLPLDPYTGRSFVYEPHPDSFTLYSARSSLVSQDGNPHPTDAQGNIVWRYTGE